MIAGLWGSGCDTYFEDEMLTSGENISNVGMTDIFRESKEAKMNSDSHISESSLTRERKYSSLP